MSPADPAGGLPPGSTKEEAAQHIGVTRTRVARRSRVREVIFGTQDGLLTTLGLVSGVGGATADRYSVLVAGVAGSGGGALGGGGGGALRSKPQGGRRR